MNGRPLIIDCDPGLDDAVALLLALASPELEVIAVTAVAGNVALGHTVRNARRVLALAGRQDVPVYAGCPRPILATADDASHWHGGDGLAGVELPESSAPVESRHAVEVLRDRLGPGADITLAATGPLTNLALAFIAWPEIAKGIREISVMGGTMGDGNVTAAAEFNVHYDPHAAQVVIGSGAPLTMFGLDVTRRTVATRGRLAAIGAIGRPAASAVAEMFEPHLTRGGGELHDVCVIAYLIRPELFEFRPMAVSVETANPATIGQTTCLQSDGSSSTRVAVAIDVDGFFALLIERLGRL